MVDDRTLTDRLSRLTLVPPKFHPGTGRLLGFTVRRRLAAMSAGRPIALRSEFPEPSEGQAVRQARKSQPTWWTKGSIPQTEHYSILKPEIAVPQEPQGSLSSDFIQTLADYDFLITAGEAESHCVLETAEDLLEVFRDRPDQLAKILLLKDCTAPVVHPEVDFHAIAQERFAEYEKLGLRFINSTGSLPF